MNASLTDIGACLYWGGLIAVGTPLLAELITKLFSKRLRGPQPKDDMTDAGCAWLTIATLVFIVGCVLYSIGRLASHVAWVN